MKLVLTFLALCLWMGITRADERLWVNAKINGKPARFIFDTGADRLILFREAAGRLGLRMLDAPPDSPSTPGTVALGETEPCDLTVWQNSIRTSLAVLEVPAYLHLGADGILGWGPLSSNIVLINALALRANFLEQLPRQATDWTKLHVRTDSGYLFLEIPHEDGTKGVVLVDTGFTGGVALHPRQWSEWKANHLHEPTTLGSYFMPGAGLVVEPETWAAKLAFGALQLTEVPVQQANPAQVAMGSRGYEASLGLAALKRLDFIVDGRHHIAYVRLKKTPPPPYDHNRLGAVFVPSDSRNDDLVARVITPGPAHEAGIRDGDVLLGINGLDTTKWRTDPAILPLSRFWTLSAGTKLHLTVRRGKEIYEVEVVLRQMLSPTAGASERRALS